jgi:hypothetical protein
MHPCRNVASEQRRIRDRTENPLIKGLSVWDISPIWTDQERTLATVAFGSRPCKNKKVRDIKIRVCDRANR